MFNRDLTIKEAAAQMNVHEETIRRWIQAGTLNAYRLNGRKLIRITQKDLDNLKEPIKNG